MGVDVKIINQLVDNYSYVVYSKKIKDALIIDPAEPKPILEFIESNGLSLKGILITHHHSDHTQGISEILKKYNVRVYSPNNSINGTTDLLNEKKEIKFSFINFNIISTPGHTLDHIVFFSTKEKILFSGDTLFYYGCGRIFEGTHKQMLNSLNKLKNLPNETKIYCGHEYSYKNLEFIINELFYWKNNMAIKSKMKEMINERGSSMPFDLGHQKDWNPFLNCDDPHYKQCIADFYKNKGKINKEASEIDFFTFVREKRNKF